MIKVVVTSALVAGIVSLGSMTIFWNGFRTPGSIGVCEKYGWRLEGSGAYQHKHCYDPKLPYVMHLPPEIDP